MNGQWVGMGTDIRLMVLDIDGTIAGVDNTVSHPVRQAIQAAKAKGVNVAIATGRMYQSATRFHREIDADMPLAAYQGALVKDPRDGTLHRHYGLPLTLANLLLNELSTYPLDAIHVYIDDQLYVQHPNTLSDWYAERSQVPLNLLADLGSTLTVEPTKILGMTADTALIDELLATMRDRFPTDQLYLTKSVPTFFEATHPAVNKGLAVQYLVFPQRQS
jgi:HAD superfamily hydrolase (TIGR01484 family)